MSEQSSTRVWERHIGYVPGRIYVNLATRTHFSHIKVEGLENIHGLPKDSAIILASNHVCALMDPLITLTTLPQPVFGARSDIFANPKVARILRWLRILPIARERNGRGEIEQNLKTFEEIYECLDNAVPFCLYPEGTHRPQRGMMPVKKGVFRIARDAAARLDKPIYVVPSGVDYEQFTREGGTVAMRYGEPIEIREFFRTRPEMCDADIFKELCEEMRRRVIDLIGREEHKCRGHKMLRFAAAVTSLPIYAACALGAMPIWLISSLLSLRMKDKAWTHTIYLGVSLFFPLHWPFHYIYAVLHNFYGNLIEDFKHS